MMRKRIISLILVLSLVMSVVAVSVSAATDEDSVVQRKIADTVPVGEGNDVPHSDRVRQEIIETAADLPAKLDLRNTGGKNYVTPVKLQNPFSTCWAFSIAGAAEISYLTANGLGVPAGQQNDLVDFSEKYISWFTYHGITADDVRIGSVRASQIGEGFDITAREKSDQNAANQIGGNILYAEQLFASGFGPVDERTEVFGNTPFAYRGINGWLLSDRYESPAAAAGRKAYYKEVYRAYIDTYLMLGYIDSADEYDQWFDLIWQEGYSVYDDTFIYPGYAGYDDWTIPVNADYRLAGEDIPLKNANILPSPASQDAWGNYRFDASGVAAIKSELYQGHGVTVGLYADQSVPNQRMDDQGYMNTTNWAQYCSDQLSRNHSVVIVGYDDNYAKENFTRTVNGAVVKNSTPPANGAFICKNSWGALTAEDGPNSNAWGVDNSGYFYLSYYDHSLETPLSFEFDTRKSSAYTTLNYDQYDLMATTSYERMDYNGQMKTANVFDAEEDETLCQISYRTAIPGTVVSYEIYHNVSANDPSSGTLLEKGETPHEYSGSHRITLKNKYLIKKGEKYAVVVSMKYQANNSGAMNYYETFALTLDTAQGDDATAVVNPGESFLYLNGKWSDYSGLVGSRVDQLYRNYVNMLGSEAAFLKLVPGGKSAISIDNYPIKAISIPAGQKITILGDTDSDGDVTIVDATLIQRHIAELPTSIFDAAAADCDEDGDVTIVDATAVQRHIAELPTAARVGETL